jgi:hypothetical protein
MPITLLAVSVQSTANFQTSTAFCRAFSTQPAIKITSTSVTRIKSFCNAEVLQRFNFSTMPELKSELKSVSIWCHLRLLVRQGLSSQISINMLLLLQDN